MTLSRMAFMGRPMTPCSCVPFKHSSSPGQAHAQLEAANRAATEPQRRPLRRQWPGGGGVAVTNAAQQSPRNTHRRQRHARGSNLSRAVHAWPCGRCMRAAKCCSCASAASHEKYGRRICRCCRRGCINAKQADAKEPRRWQHRVGRDDRSHRHSRREA